MSSHTHMMKQEVLQALVCNATCTLGRHKHLGKLRALLPRAVISLKVPPQGEASVFGAGLFLVSPSL